MAITIPTTRSVLPEQNASQEINPSRQFGNQVAAPINMPDVPRGMAGVQFDDSAAQNAYANMGQKVGAAAMQVLDDRVKQEDNLRRANETVEFEKSKIDFHNAASEAMQTAKMLRQSGDLIDDDDAKGYYETKLLQLRDQYLPEGKYKSLEVDTHSRVYAVDALNKYKNSFRDNVIIPEQTAKYVKTINETNSARSVQALNDGRMAPIEQVIPTLKSGLQAIDTQYDSPALSILMKPDQIEKGRQEAKLQYLQSMMTGMAERDINFSDPKADKLQIWQRQIANQQRIKEMIFGDATIAATFGGKVDEATRAIDNSIIQKQTLIQSEQDRRQRAAEAAAERAERNAIAAVKADVALYGTDSKYLSNIDKLPPTQRAAAMEGYETFNRRQDSTLGQAQTYEKKFAGKPQALANPTKEDLKMVDSNFEIAKKQLAGMKPDEQLAYMSRNYYSVGVVPTEVKENISRGLNSSDPAIVKQALDSMFQIEKANPNAAASAFKPEQKSMLISHKAGVDTQKIVDFRDKQSALESRPDAEINKLAYKGAGNVKNEVEFKNKVDLKLSSEASAWYQFGKADIAPAVRDEVAERTKVYMNNNIPFKDAVKQAYLDVSLTAGLSNLSGPKRTVVRFSPEVMTGQSSIQLQKRLEPVLENIKGLVDGYKDVPNENFILMPSERTTVTNPTFEIWYRDKYGNAIKVRDNNFQPIYFNAKRQD